MKVADLDAKADAAKCIAVRLRPRDEKLARHVSEVRVLIDTEGGWARRVEMLDADGDRTVIEFRNVKVNTGLTDHDLEVEVPAGRKGVASTGGAMRATPARNAAGDHGLPALWMGVRRQAAEFWLRYLMWTARNTPWFARVSRGFFLWWGWNCAVSLRDGTLANARAIPGARVDTTQRARLARGMLVNFYGFVCEMGRNRYRTVEEIAAGVRGTR